MSDIKLPTEWLEKLQPEFDAPYMRQLRAFLAADKATGKMIYPPGSLWFNALNHTPFSQVKVVILGQDPYHGAQQAHGLCFSVPDGIAPPPSLVNIFAEIKRDLGIEPPPHGNLTRWADQGVLLLNSVLTVEHGKAGAHQGKGWEIFTDKIIALLNEQREHIVFLLWGNYAQKKGALIDRQKHLVLTAPHPSPLSVYRGFSGCGHFSASNTYLKNNNIQEIHW
ncbi:MAG TPA: uracil-DNA glycosylase [Pseudomonadales bacterium]|nr:uracil-DNA glycosylase [Pseudomonadales bacterium]HNN86138.1 uracil-DNA glycosylase [Pseudomonadales bacterium]